MHLGCKSLSCWDQQEKSNFLEINLSVEKILIYYLWLMLTKTEVYFQFNTPRGSGNIFHLMSHNLHEYENNEGEKTSRNSMENLHDISINNVAARICYLN